MNTGDKSCWNTSEAVSYTHLDVYKRQVYFSNKMGVKYSIPENAEVISSIGVALDVYKRQVQDCMYSTARTPFLRQPSRTRFSLPILLMSFR